MTNQNYQNHRRLDPMFHYFSFSVLLACTIGSSINLYHASVRGENLYNASLLLVLCIMTLLGFLLFRKYALVAQDRAIRAEENLRHFSLTGKFLDSRLSVQQIVALRFAGDTEFVALAKKAADENLSSNDIKKSITNWRADHYRV